MLVGPLPLLQVQRFSESNSSEGALIPVHMFRVGLWVSGWDRKSILAQLFGKKKNIPEFVRERIGLCDSFLHSVELWTG